MKTHASRARCLLAILLAFAGALPAAAGCDAACRAGGMACCEPDSQPAVSAPCCASHARASERVVPATPAGPRWSTDLPSTPGTIVADVAVHREVESLPASPSAPPRAPSAPRFLLYSVLLS